VAAVTVLLGAALVACGDTQDASGRTGPPPAAVEVVTLRPGPVRDVVSFAGQLNAEESVVVRSETSGIIASIEFEEGQRVEADALLFRLRDDEQRAEVAAARAALLLAERVHGRGGKLRADGVLSVEDLDRARAELDRARAAVEVVEVALRRTEIRAPFDGVVGARLVSPGDYVQGGGMRGRIGDDPTGLVTIEAVDNVRLLFSVPERAVPVVRVGMPLTVTVTPYPDERFEGALYFVAPALDSRNRRLLVKGLIPNPKRRLRPGLSATVHLEISSRDDVLMVPEAALVYDATGDFVWRLLDDGTAQRAPVEVGVRQGGRVEVVSGLAAGDRVVSAGVNKVAPGRPLLITNDVPATS
jgi:membrane fusion protein (multidrug efflux system)